MSVVTANNSLILTYTQQLSFGINQTQNITIPVAFRSLFKSFGVLLDQCNLVSCFTMTFLASTPQNIDLKSLLDITGATAVMARTRMFGCRVNSTTDGQILLLGANGTNDWLGLSSTGSTVTVYPSTAANDGFTIFQMPNSTGAAVGASTHLLKADPGAHAFTADFLIAGCDS